MSIEKISAEEKKKVEEYWDLYRELGIDPATQVYDEVSLEDGPGMMWGETVAEQAYYQFEDSFVCPYCGRDSEHIGAGAPDLTRFKTRFSARSDYLIDGYSELRVHLAVYHSEEDKLKIDRSRMDYWDQVQAYVNKNEATSHQVWTREFQKVWAAISKLQKKDKK